MRQIIRISNDGIGPMRVLIEPLAEEKSLAPKEELYVLAEIRSETAVYEDVLEISKDRDGIVIYYSAQVIVDWCPEGMVKLRSGEPI